jgi:hypothetical protein
VGFSLLCFETLIRWQHRGGSGGSSLFSIPLLSTALSFWGSCCTACYCLSTEHQLALELIQEKTCYTCDSHLPAQAPHLLSPRATEFIWAPLLLTGSFCPFFSSLAFRVCEEVDISGELPQPSEQNPQHRVEVGCHTEGDLVVLPFLPVSLPSPQPVFSACWWERVAIDEEGVEVPGTRKYLPSLIFRVWGCHATLGPSSASPTKPSHKS